MTFAERVVKIVSEIPRGKVTSYSHVAALAGSPRGARTVGMILRHLPETTHVPWQRVISKSGRISIININIPAQFQAELLQNEGIAVTEENGHLWIKDPNYFWEGN